MVYSAWCGGPDARRIVWDCRVSTSSLPGLSAAARGRQPATWTDLNKSQQQLLELRLAHLREVETGFRSGDPLQPRRAAAAIRLRPRSAANRPTSGEGRRTRGVAAAGT